MLNPNKNSLQGALHHVKSHVLVLLGFTTVSFKGRISTRIQASARLVMKTSNVAQVQRRLKPWWRKPQ
jgi:RecB family endonuclease NucS